MSNRKLKIKRKYTNRGFRLLLFKDDYGEECSLQKSSTIEPHVWLGINNPKRLLDGNNNLSGIVFARMHLNQKQAKQLADELMFFVDNGHLK